MSRVCRCRTRQLCEFPSPSHSFFPRFFRFPLSRLLLFVDQGGREERLTNFASAVKRLDSAEVRRRALGGRDKAGTCSLQFF